MPEQTVEGTRYNWLPSEEKLGRAIERLEDDLASLRLERDGLEHQRRRDNEYLIGLIQRAWPFVAFAAQMDGAEQWMRDTKHLALATDKEVGG